jgi:hypothetical protein
MRAIRSQLTPHGRPLYSRGPIVYLLLADIALSLILSVAAIYFSLVASHASHRSVEAASQAHIAQIAAQVNCYYGNLFRKDNLHLWFTVLGLLDTHTPAGQQFVAKVRAEVTAVDSPRPCPPTTPPARSRHR